MHFEKSNREQNQALLLKCAELKNRLETEIGEPIVLQKEWGKTWARMYVEKQQGKITDDLKEWAVEKMHILIQVGTTILTKYGTKRGGVAIGKLIPFGVGVVVGGGFSYLTMKKFGDSARKYFSLKVRHREI